MAKLQQMNEMTKQSSQILLNNGYVTYEGKKFSECEPHEKEAFNDALHIVRVSDIQDQEPPILNLFEMRKENYTPSGKVSKAMFDCLISKVRIEEESTLDYFVISSSHGVYHLCVGGEWVKRGGQSRIEITCNDSYVEYRGSYYDLQFTEEQQDTLLDLLCKTYNNLEDEEHYRWCDNYETNKMRYEESLSHDWHQFI